VAKLWGWRASRFRTNPNIFLGIFQMLFADLRILTKDTHFAANTWDSYEEGYVFIFRF
jgi:hypothetical protein